MDSPAQPLPAQSAPTPAAAENVAASLPAVSRSAIAPAPAPPSIKRRNLRNFVASVRYSIDGFRAALEHEPSFREDLLFAALLIPFAIILPVNAVSTALMIGALFIIIIVELLNSAIEWTIDYLRPEHHPLAKRIKDMASAAVFLSYLNCLVIWAVLLWPGSGAWNRLMGWLAS